MSHVVWNPNPGCCLFSAPELVVFLQRSHIKSPIEREVHCLIAAVLLRTGLNDVFDDSKRVFLKYFLSFSFLSCHVSPLVSFILICFFKIYLFYFFYHTSSPCPPPPITRPVICPSVTIDVSVVCVFVCVYMHVIWHWVASH